MKLPDVLTGLLPKKQETKEHFFSLYLDRDAAAVAAWYMDENNTPRIGSFAHAVIAQDSWEVRIQVVDRLLSAAEDKVGVTKAITKTVFGIPSVYLTADGNIIDTVRPHLKKLSQMLELTPAGFVPLVAAIAFQLKKDEGVPPSVILIGCSGLNAHVTVFRVGNPSHDDTIDLGEDPAAALETVLKKHQDGDVLPSRILLFGGNVTVLEELRSKLLKHPWPTRTNFLHFPKIELVDLEELLTSVSLAGASELAQEMKVSEVTGEASTVIAQAGVSEEKEEGEPEEGEQEVEPDDEEVANVKVVTPESFGFRHEDVLEHVEEPKKQKISLPHVTMPHLSFDKFKNLRSIRLPKFHAGVLPVGIGVVLLLLLGGLLYYNIPRATVTVLVAAVSVDESTNITVGKDATVADPTKKIIPGKTLEQSVSGEKTIAVTGKKNVGDQARGTVTIYNKVTSSRSLPKGTTLTSGSVVFTLDSDVSVASASESIGSITFGKATANITAREIGANGNLSSGSEFTFANVSGSQVSARNDSAFTGGTSRQVTVISRADQDALVKALTDDLVEKAKQQLLTSGQSGERLIDQTIKTQVAEKVFDQELDEEAKELHGKVTITVSGVAISDEDVKSVLMSLVEAKVPSGYRIAPEQTTVGTTNVSVKKDGSISLTAKLTSVALPTIDTEALKGELAGRNVTQATEMLRLTTGVAGAEYRFMLSPTTSRLPLKRNNISVTVMVQ